MEPAKCQARTDLPVVLLAGRGGGGGRGGLPYEKVLPPVS